MKHTQILIFLLFLVSFSCSSDIHLSLLDASSQGDIETVRTLLAQKANINIKTKNGTTPLMLAAMKGHVATVKLLIDNGAFVNAKNKFGVTALMYAALENRRDAVAVLLDRGAKINLRSKKGKTALIFAQERQNIEIAEMLKKTKVKLESEFSESGFDSNLIAAVASGHIPTVKRIISKGVDINETDEDGNTALIWAASLGQTAIVKLLLENGADVNIRNNYNDTALKSVSYNKLEIIGLLQQAGAKR